MDDDGRMKNQTSFPLTDEAEAKDKPRMKVEDYEGYAESNWFFEVHDIPGW